MSLSVKGLALTAAIFWGALMFLMGISHLVWPSYGLAFLELVRHRHVLAEQNRLHGEIWILPSDGFSKTFDASNVDQYTHGSEEDDEVLTANSE